MDAKLSAAMGSCTATREASTCGYAFSRSWANARRLVCQAQRLRCDSLCWPAQGLLVLSPARCLRPRTPAQRGSATISWGARRGDTAAGARSAPPRFWNADFRSIAPCVLQGASSPTHRSEDLAVAASLRRPTSSAETRPRGTRPLSTSNSRIAFTVSSPRRPSV